jgi:hypothetical protein
VRYCRIRELIKLIPGNVTQTRSRAIVDIAGVPDGATGGDCQSVAVARAPKAVEERRVHVPHNISQLTRRLGRDERQIPRGAVSLIGYRP